MVLPRRPVMTDEQRRDIAKVQDRGRRLRMVVSMDHVRPLADVSQTVDDRDAGRAQLFDDRAEARSARRRNEFGQPRRR
jgi:hypothetical protein